MQVNLKLYAAAVFFAPNISYYQVPRSGSRSGALQKAVMVSPYLTSKVLLY